MVKTALQSHWKTSKAEVMPYSIGRNQNLPNGVLKVVSNENLIMCLFCQKPLLLSSVENTWHWAWVMQHLQLFSLDTRVFLGLY